MVHMNLPGNYVLLESENFKFQATVDYREVKTDVFASVFTRFAFLSAGHSARVEIKLSYSSLLSISVHSSSGEVKMFTQGKFLLGEKIF